MPAKPKGYHPKNPLVHPRFGDIATFNRLPYVPDIKGKKVDVAVLGVPFDGGTTYRPGARFAPKAVRAASSLNRNFNPVLGLGVFEKLSVVDAGDVSVNPLNMQKTLAEIEKKITEIHKAKARTVTVGGDHSIVLAELRALSKFYKNMTFIQFDAHTDTADSAWEEKYHHGTPIRRAIEEGILQGERVFQIGIRGPLTDASQDVDVAKMGINVLSVDDFQDAKKHAQFFAKIRKTAGNGPCFISFDVDGVDPAFTPGTGTPVVGGLTSREALSAVRAFKGLKLVGADVVEISPAYDHAEITSLFGAALVFEFLSLMAAK